MANILFTLVLFSVNVVVGVVGLALAILGGLMTWSKSATTRTFGEIWGRYLEKMNLTNTSSEQTIVDVTLKMSGHYSRPIFAIGLIILIICIAGILGSCCKSSLCLKIYIAAISIFIITHIIILIVYFASKQQPHKFLIQFLNYSIHEYVSISSGDPNSILMGLIMMKLNCCGARNGSDFYHPVKFDRTDVWNGVTYTNLKYPVPCCRFNGNLEIQDESCPKSFKISNIHNGCLKPLHRLLTYYVDIAAYLSLMLLLCEIIIFLMAILINKRR
ncbi:unnamed protein product [Schistosoma rodhaini]|uniref:Tetraspanin n=1 Tax=Schistosoma rodhaini TaxID=6188 RepID=A0AA85GHF0_9TREM|nr:unnamed protein product [Schistosoma rodhaini]